MGRTETTAELGVDKGDLVTTPSILTRTDIYGKFGGVQGGPCINTKVPPQDGERQWGDIVGGA